jgi:putative ABC transport system permease protein
MREHRAWFQRLSGLFHKERRDHELDAELESHLQMHIEDNLRAGMTLEEARRQALIKLGGVEATKERYRDRRGLPLIETTIQDIRFAIRLLSKAPTVTFVAVLSLALGIGANTAIFSLVDTVMLRMLPVQKPEQLVEIRMRNQGDKEANPIVTNPVWEELRNRQNVFSGALAWSTRNFDLADGGEAQYVPGIFASGDYFVTLGVRPVAGRVFTAADDHRGCPGVAVVSYGFWQGHYGAVESAIGSTLRIDGYGFQVIGVAQPGFSGLDVGERFDVAVPMCAEAIIAGKNSMLDMRSAWWMRVLGRLKPGATLERANAQINVLAPEILRATVPAKWNTQQQKRYLQKTLVISPAGTGVSNLRRSYERPLIMLMVIVGFVLLIACANIASLFLSRAAARQKEIAVRLSLGASRTRLVRQMLTESIVLSGAGALLGLLFARWGGSLLVRFVSTSKDAVFLDLSMDHRVLGFTVAIAILTGVLFGALPALRVTRVSPASVIKGSDERTDATHSRFHSGRWIVAFQLALSMILLVGTGLFLRSFRNLTTLNPGFERNGVLLVMMDVHNANVPKEARVTFYAQILDRLKSIPGVSSASQDWFVPMSGHEWNDDIAVDGYKPAAGEEPLVWFNWITPDYFTTLRTPLLAGRPFDGRDTASSEQVAIVNESMAQHFFPGASPLGKYFRVTEGGLASSQPLRIVGVVKDSKYDSLREDYLPFAYVPLTQMTQVEDGSVFQIRAYVSPDSLIPAVRDSIGGVNKSVSMQFGTLAQMVDDTLVQERLLATLSGFFGGLALLLTAIGLYGVMAYAVTQRTHEIGIRMALGAQPRSILTLVMRDVAILLATGAAAGIIGALWLTRLVQQLLFGLKANDLGTLALATGALVLIALIASYLPARRAMRVDPMVALRYE